MELLETQNPSRQALVQLVQKCLNEHGETEGFIERQQFISFCVDLSVSVDELDNVFNELDGDHDGRINASDFTNGFDLVSCFINKEEPEQQNVVNGSVDKSLYECQVDGVGSPMQIIGGQQYISELYYNLTNSNQPDLLDLFEKHLASVVKDIKSRAAETQRLEEALKRATKQHARQVNNLDHEVEQQMEKLEAKVRREEQSLSEKKLSDLKWQLESKEREIANMGATIEILQSTLQKEAPKAPKKEEMESLSLENRLLRSQVTDSQTAIAVMRSDLAQLQSEFVEQSEQLQKEKDVACDSLQEQENLVRQLQLLHEANQRLHDINDELRGALEAKKTPPSPRRITPEVLTLSAVISEAAGRELSPSIRSNRSSRCNSFTHNHHRHSSGGDENSLNESSLFSELHRASTPCKSDLEEEDEAYGTMSKPGNELVEKQIQILEDTNKRLSSSNDELRVALKLITRSGSFRKSKKSPSVSRRVPSIHSDYGSLSSRSSRSFSPKEKRTSAADVGDGTDESTTYDAEVEDDDHVETVSDSTTMNSETIADVETQFSKVTETHDDKEGNKSNKEEKEDIEEDDEDEEDDDDDDDDDEISEELAELVAIVSDLSEDSDTDSDNEINGNRIRRPSNASNHEEVSTMTTESLSLSFGTPERMYKLVLAGDAAVGKSSFILRLCRNRFHSSLNATLGVDFQVKNIRVDSKIVALQLWDTAGQERFRSIAKSYFRKVDGVLLLYDVTCESSFVNVREWMQTIEESSQKKVPVMLCANKCDIREQMKAEGHKVVSKESGQKLAKHYDALFTETSAKDGKNIEMACVELARILATIENKEIEQSCLKLDKNDKDKKKRPCCPS